MLCPGNPAWCLPHRTSLKEIPITPALGRHCYPHCLDADRDSQRMNTLPKDTRLVPVRDRIYIPSWFNFEVTSVQQQTALIQSLYKDLMAESCVFASPVPQGLSPPCPLGNPLCLVLGVTMDLVPIPFSFFLLLVTSPPGSPPCLGPSGK